MVKKDTERNNLLYQVEQTGSNQRWNGTERQVTEVKRDREAVIQGGARQRDSNKRWRGAKKQ